MHVSYGEGVSGVASFMTINESNITKGLQGMA